MERNRKRLIRVNQTTLVRRERTGTRGGRGAGVFVFELREIKRGRQWFVVSFDTGGVRGRGGTTHRGVPVQWQRLGRGEGEGGKGKGEWVR